MPKQSLPLSFPLGLARVPMCLCGFYQSLWAFAAFKSKSKCIILLYCFKSLNMDVPVKMTRGASIQPCLERSERGIKEVCILKLSFWHAKPSIKQRYLVQDFHFYMSKEGRWIQILIQRLKRLHNNVLSHFCGFWRKWMSVNLKAGGWL